MTTINANTGNPIDTAHHYAEYLASYISDPSTIRSHTLDQFGMAPNMEAIREMRAKVIASRAQPWNGLMGDKYIGSKYDIVEPVQPVAKVIPFVPRNRPPPLDPDEIIKQIANELGSSYSEIIGKSKPRRVTRVRFLIAGLFVERGNSYSQTGMFLGGRDHKTAHHACNVLRDMLKRDPELTAIYKKYCALWGLSGRYIR